MSDAPRLLARLRAALGRSAGAAADWREARVAQAVPGVAEALGAIAERWPELARAGDDACERPVFVLASSWRSGSGISGNWFISWPVDGTTDTLAV